MPCALEALRVDELLWRQQQAPQASVKALHGLLANGSPPEAGYAGFALARWYAWQVDRFREIFEALGYWDRVRVEADTEYCYRIRAAFGNQAIGEVLPGVPLAFGRTVADSLTAVGATHLITQFGGVRGDYREASQAWHRAGTGRPERLYLPAEPDERPFAVPEAMLP